MSELMFSLQEIMQSHIKAMETELRILSREKYQHAIIRSGSWTNQKFITVYVSFFPMGDPSEESVDFIMHLIMSESIVRFQVDITRSNGELIADIWNEKIEYETNGDLLTAVENLSRIASEMLIIRFAKLDLNGTSQ